MISIIGYTNDKKWLSDLTVDQLEAADLDWFWVDFCDPKEDECKLLDTYFRFHPLAIEDCYHLLQRPKMDHYDDVHFLVLHDIEDKHLSVNEINLFIGRRFIVTFHYEPSAEIEQARKKLLSAAPLPERGHLYAAYLVIDKLVDRYFPAVQELEEHLLDMEIGGDSDPSQKMMNDIFSIRSRLLRLRKTIVPMRDLLYRLINSDRIEGLKPYLAFYHDVYDHLLKLSEMLDSCREITTDLRDSYISYNSHRMNTIMKTLTVITTIFMPLTFLAGIYGMNFTYMPELDWSWGYFAVILVMLATGISMYAWFRTKGWFK
ncbi:magnesium/cobalt transporter CorA [Paenibacillus arenilitoris]|uniref:Magnesium transport protein CorA n=1 Tax=Paenibacillus arenilitoris TaxID=2772299 RepID=A0A927CPM7_9BACL|nr:magnesium/cobalt transporter CorA [Paenibacillus arenilitoris]MBD2871182.1 magnesium/cobalt transporter CorA [Paenibacillus arenilitoris]